MAALLGQAQKEVLRWVTGDKTAPQAGERRPRRVPRDVCRNHLYLWIKNVFAACFSGAAEPATHSSVLVTARPAAGKGIAASLSPESNKMQQPEPDVWLELPTSSDGAAGGKVCSSLQPALERFRTGEWRFPLAALPQRCLLFP